MMLVIYCKWTHNPEPLSHKNKDLCLINIVLSTWVIKKKMSKLILCGFEPDVLSNFKALVAET